MKPKPILLVKFKSSIVTSDVLQSIAYKLNKQMQDYHVLVLAENMEEESKFELLSVNNATDIELEELKQRIKPYLDEAINN